MRTQTELFNGADAEAGGKIGANVPSQERKTPRAQHTHTVHKSIWNRGGECHVDIRLTLNVYTKDAAETSLSWSGSTNLLESCYWITWQQPGYILQCKTLQECVVCVCVFLAERGPIQSNIGIGFDINLIYPSNIGQTSAIHIPFCSLHWTVNVLHGNLRLQLAMCASHSFKGWK